MEAFTVVLMVILDDECGRWKRQNNNLKIVAWLGKTHACCVEITTRGETIQNNALQTCCVQFQEQWGSKKTKCTYWPSFLLACLVERHYLVFVLAMKIIRYSSCHSEQTKITYWTLCLANPYYNAQLGWCSVRCRFKDKRFKGHMHQYSMPLFGYWVKTSWMILWSKFATSQHHVDIIG